MRLLIELSSSDNNPITIPIHYNHLIQSAIYGALDNDFAIFSTIPDLKAVAAGLSFLHFPV